MPSPTTAKMKMEIVRPASTNERRFIISDAIGFSHCIVLVARYSGPLTDDDSLHTSLSNAIQYCIDEHPALRVTITDASSKQPQLALVDSIDLNEHLVYVNDPHVGQGQGEQERIKSFLEYLHDARLPRAGGRPQWCFYVRKASASESPGFYLAFMHSHMLWDGPGNIILNETILRILNGEQAIPSKERKTQLLPAVEGAGKLTISWSYLLPILARELLPKWLSSALGCQDEDLSGVWISSKTHAPLKIDARDPLTSVQVSLIPGTTVQHAIKTCRSHGARPTGMLTYLVAHALCRALAARGQSYSKIRAGLAIDLRKALNKGQGALVNYVSFVTETITVKDGGIAEDVWESIRKTTQRLADASNTLADHPTALLKYISNMQEWLETSACQPSTVSFGLSNLGIFDGSAFPGETDPKRWHSDTAVISQSGNRTGSPLTFQLFSTKNGYMGITATWWPGMLDVDDEDVFVREVLDDLEEGMKTIQ